MQAATAQGSTGLDPRQIEHRRAWEQKPTLRLLYQDYHRRLLNACPPGPLLDIGGGTAHIKQERPDAVSVDILPFPGIDVACDAHTLPFRDKSFSGVVMLDVLHHLARPAPFLAEAARVLRPGGVLAMIEPGMTALSYPFYRHFHQEPADMKADPFAEPPPDEKRDPFDSNQAIPTLLFAHAAHQRELARRVPDLRARKIDWLSLFAFPLSGGFKAWCLMPASMTPAVVRAEDALPAFLRRLFAFRIFIVLEKTP